MRRIETLPLARIMGSTSFDDLADCDLFVEATVEELTVKQAIFATLDEIAKPGAILATTTSSLPVVEIAAATHRMPDVVGMHFFNPAPVMKLVEVVQTVNTSERVAATLRAVCERIGKHPVTCGDRAGFIVNALLFPYLNDAVRMLRGALRDGRRHRQRDEGRLRVPDGSVRTARRGGARRRAGHPTHALPGVPRAGLSRPLRFWSTWSRPATSAASPVADSASTPRP